MDPGRTGNRLGDLLWQLAVGLVVFAVALDLAANTIRRQLGVIALTAILVTVALVAWRGRGGGPAEF